MNTVKIQADGYLVDGSLSVPNAPGNRHWQAVQEWIAEGNTPELEFTQAELDAQAEQAVEDESKQAEREAKLTGIEFEGVMCSATAEDMWGLSSIQGYVASGLSVPFKFNNGNVLLLTPSNMAAFQEVWVPFRASFF